MSCWIVVAEAEEPNFRLLLSSVVSDVSLKGMMLVRVEVVQVGDGL